MGFVKVLVTSLQPEKLLKLRADIMSDNGILKWSECTKHHFKGKVSRSVPRFNFDSICPGCTNIGNMLYLQVVLILEILIRKCGFDAINLVTPDEYKDFVTSVEEVRFPILSLFSLCYLAEMSCLRNA